MRTWSLILLCSTLAGCSLTALKEADRGIAVNQCDEEIRCPEEQQCKDSRCVSSGGTLSNLLFEIAPGVSAGALSGAQLFYVGDMVPLVPAAYSITLNDVVNVKGYLNAAPATDCGFTFIGENGEELQQASDGSIPARLTFSPTQRTWGVAAPSVQTTTKPDIKTGVYSFNVSLAGGAYDVYVEPFPTLAPSASLVKACVLTPQLFRKQDLARSTSLNLSVPTPRRLDMTVRFAEGDQNLDGWRADMLEAITGRVISSPVELKLPTRSNGSLVYTFGVDYVPVWGDDDSKHTGKELLRLSPPSGVTAPSLYFWRVGLEWATPGMGDIDTLGAFPAPVSYSGSVISAGPMGEPVPSNVTFTAKEVAQVSSGLFPSFIRSAKTDAQGRFNLDLLPGTYNAIATPLSASDTGRPFAVSTTEVTILPNRPVQAGTALSVAPSLDIQGVVRTPSGDPVRGATISAEISPVRTDEDVFDRAIGDLSAPPRVTSASVDDSGGFHLFAEPQIYNLSVRPAASSGFAWLVMPGFAPQVNPNADADANADIDPEAPIALPSDLFLPAPVPIELKLNLPTRGDAMTLLEGAAVRAYALLDADGSPTTDSKAAVSAVRVAEGRVDSALHSTLLLPAKLDRPPDGFTPPGNPTP